MASSTPSTTTTTTMAPYRISRQELFSILQRNSIGIGRLFRREYDSAMQDSKVNLNRFKQEFRLAVAPFLQPATTEASTTTTSSSRRRR
ncbi:Envelope glycoprotein B [Frankliniella fusca]|uniref:Envelope glycoprotein B n=1 Tax=Frankliniella fusca TaxID=407009 RepID=A0AAE1LED7_9NEOP|nr:Envelope glycoprotein B [Frankliniella fusca]